MGIFDKNIHMNGSRTTYQAFLDLADAAEEKGGTIGDRTVRLVKAGDGLATTTSLGTKGARADQIADAHRAIYTFNGTTYNHKHADELVPAFKALVPDPKKQRALSTYLNQLCYETILLPSSCVPYDTGVEAHKLPGFDALVNRDLTSGLYQAPVLYTSGHVLKHDLKLSEDGRTATITQTITADLSGLKANMNDANSFGQVTFSQRLVIDLEPDIPVVTDYKLSQTIE